MTLRGPRRVGKTVALKLLIAELIEKHAWDPQTITWTALDTFRTLVQLEEHLLNIAVERKPRLLVVDEATTVTGWQRVVKKLRDDGTLADCCIILTGSSAYDLKAGAERMAGRRGDVPDPDRVLLPMSFHDFASHVHGGKGAVQDYLRVGGFPFRVEQFLLKRDWNEFDGFQVFDDVLFYELTRRRLDRSIAIEVLGRLSAIGCSSASYEAFIKPLSMAKDTARKYLDALGDAFLLATISSYDTSRGRVAPKKDRKFVWIDPALGYTGKWLRQAEAPSDASRAEWAVGATLLRHHEPRLWEGLSAPRGVFTWKSSGGNEIDYLVVDKSRKLLFPVEVKYQNSISDWDFQVIERAFGRGWLVSPEIDRARQKSEALSLEHFFSQVGTIGAAPNPSPGGISKG
ncbi:MAG: hypothetical protein A2X94_03910 [Bdellovibrionales bacterium GWB1_55_8]|nr:MAG: hypothetical protein A2X94_03910 [Bdellovibrionales bacterium GWB1_55_8]